MRNFKIKEHWKLFLILSCSLALLLYIFWGLPNPLRLSTNPAPASTKLLDRHGKPIYEIFVTQRRTPIELKTLPKHVWQATLAAEDRDFYSHSGFSIRGIARAFLNTFFKNNVQGGSTITQQLVKKALLTDERTVKRKARELVLSIAVEMLYSKDKILEFYLNEIPYGGTAYGIESAAKTYFGKSAANLTIAQSAMLAALPQAPTLYSPFGARPELGRERQQHILKLMLDDKFISSEEYETAKNEALTLILPSSIQAPHFSLWVKNILVQKYGLETVEQGGLTVTTSLDLDLQQFAESAVATEVGKLKKEHVGNGAVLATDPKTGEIFAMVGSKDYFNTEADGNVNVTLALRQPGSAIKPINYALALDHKLITASTVLADKPTCFAIPDQPNYCPSNYDNAWHGPTQVRFALGNSFNIPAVKVLALNGLENFVASSSAFGITTFKDAKNYGPSLTLGGGEVTMLDLSTAYGVLANLGQRVNLSPIIRVVDKSGKVLESMKLRPIDDKSINPLDTIVIDQKIYTPIAPSNTRVISTGAAYIISHLLLDNGARSAAFGPSSYLVVKNHPEVSVKTGTTNDKRDNWTIGYNPDVLVAVWVGNNNNSPMSNVASGVTGASPIWNKVVSKALEKYPQHWPIQPPDVVGSLVCSVSGLKAVDGMQDCTPRYEYFLKGTVPPLQGDLHRDIAIFKPTQAPASTKQITEQPGDVENQNHSVIFDPTGAMLCLDCSGGYGEANLIRLDRHGKAIKN